jgi:hypothetical protein
MTEGPYHPLVWVRFLVFHAFEVGHVGLLPHQFFFKLALALHKVLRPFLNLVLKDLIIFFWVL